MSAQQKEDYGWVWARKKLETPTKKLLFEGNELYKNNDIFLILCAGLCNLILSTHMLVSKL